MKKTFHATERGQVIVFLVVGLVVFLGFTALAIDAGMAYSDRRYAQNSSDAASLAGGGDAALYLEDHHVINTSWHCNDPDVGQAMDEAIDNAISRAAANNFVIDGDPSDGNGVSVSCGGTNYGWYNDVYLDVTVNISTTTETSFAHLLFPDVLHIQVDSTTRVRPRQAWGFGNAIVALNPTGCLGQQYGGIYYGDGNLEVTGGGIWTNGCLSGSGQPIVEVIDGEINYGRDFNPGNATWSPYPPDEPVDYQIPPGAYDVETPNCTGRWVDDNDIPRNGTEIEPGLYCMHGDFRINANDEVVGHGVTFYIEGDINFRGGADIFLEAPEPSPDPSPALAGVLIYVPRLSGHTCADQTVSINGNSESHFRGLIIGPCADITLNGTGNVYAYETQVIGWNVLVGGTADTYVFFDEERLSLRPTFIELSR